MTRADAPPLSGIAENFFFLLSAAQLGFYHQFIQENDPDKIGWEMTKEAIGRICDTLVNENVTDHLDALDAPAGLDAEISKSVIGAYRTHLWWAGVFLNYRDEWERMVREEKSPHPVLRLVDKPAMP